MEEKYKPFRLFDVMAAAAPDYFVHLGDTVYADIPGGKFSPIAGALPAQAFTHPGDRPLQAFPGAVRHQRDLGRPWIENDAHGGLPQLAVAEQVFRRVLAPCDSAANRGSIVRFRSHPKWISSSSTRGASQRTGDD